jgi:hypothetical protein
MTAYTGSVLFLARNRIDDATLTASSAATPASHLQNPRPGRKWYATGKADEYVQAAFPTSVLIQHIAYVGFNVDVTGVGRVRLNTAASFDGADIRDTGEFEMWRPVAGWGHDGWGVSLGGYPVLDSFNDYRPIRYIDLGQSYSAPYLRAYLKNPSNDSIAQVGNGWLYAGVGFQPSWPHNWNWTVKWVDPTETTRTISSVFKRAVKSYRQISLSLDDLTEAEAIGGIDIIQRAIGKKKPMVVVLFPEGGTPLQAATTIFGYMADDPDRVHTGTNRYSIQVTIEELVA